MFCALSFKNKKKDFHSQQLNYVSSDDEWSIFHMAASTLNEEIVRLVTNVYVKDSAGIPVPKNKKGVKKKEPMNDKLGKKKKRKHLQMKYNYKAVNLALQKNSRPRNSFVRSGLYLMQLCAKYKNFYRPCVSTSSFY